ncbi:unnamed protein product, partial [Phaeothamnion confervicola]
MLQHEHIMTVVLQQLLHERVVVRKRATSCLGSLAVVASDPLLNRLTEDLLQRIEASTSDPDVVRTLLQTIGTISRTVGYRLGRHLDVIVPLFLRVCGDPTDESQHSEAANELRENCFQGFESFVMRCPREVSSHLGAIIDVSLKYAKYDPNYNYGDSDDDENGGGAMEEDGNEEFSDDDFADDDDDDTSWKVRRSAIKVLRAVILCRAELLQELYQTCCDELIGRFKEREENVRIDVIECFRKLLEATLAAEARRQQAEESAAHAHINVLNQQRQPAVIRQKEAVARLVEKLPMIVRASEKQLKASGKSPKTTAAVFQMLRTLCLVLHGGLDKFLPALVDNVNRCIQDKNQARRAFSLFLLIKTKQTLKLEALVFLRLCMEQHPPHVFYPYVPRIAPLVTACVGEDWYKIIAEALRVVCQLIRILRPLDGLDGAGAGGGGGGSAIAGDNAAAGAFDYRPYAEPLYAAILPRLRAHDIDQEIKECTIAAMGVLLAHLGTDLPGKLPDVLRLLMDRLRNEITRMATLKALTLVATSPLPVDLSSVVGEATEELASLLRQQSRPLKQATLEALVALVGSNAQHMTSPLFEKVLREAAPLVSDADLHLAHLALTLTYGVLAAAPEAAPAVGREVLPRAMTLATSPLLQGMALASLLKLLRGLVAANAKGLRFKDLLDMLRGAVAEGGDAMPRQAIANIAKAMAALC